MECDRRLYDGTQIIGRHWTLDQVHYGWVCCSLLPCYLLSTTCGENLLASFKRNSIFKNSGLKGLNKGGCSDLQKFVLLLQDYQELCYEKNKLMEPGNLSGPAAVQAQPLNLKNLTKED